MLTRWQPHTWLHCFVIPDGFLIVLHFTEYAIDGSDYEFPDAQIHPCTGMACLAAGVSRMLTPWKRRLQTR